MKSKIFISLLLTLVLLVSFTTPVFAKSDKVAILAWQNWDFVPITATESGYVKYQVTHDNLLKITVDMQGLTPGDQYIIGDSASYFMWGFNPFTVDERGVLKFSCISTGSPNSVPQRIYIYLYTGSLMITYGTEEFTP